jgi:hypothetical protein
MQMLVVALVLFIYLHTAYLSLCISIGISLYISIYRIYLLTYIFKILFRHLFLLKYTQTQCVLSY